MARLKLFTFILKFGIFICCVFYCCYLYFIIIHMHSVADRLKYTRTYAHTPSPLCFFISEYICKMFKTAPKSKIAQSLLLCSYFFSLFVFLYLSLVLLIWLGFDQWSMLMFTCLIQFGFPRPNDKFKTILKKHDRDTQNFIAILPIAKIKYNGNKKKIQIIFFSLPLLSFK